MNFSYHMPTKIIFESNCIIKNSNIFKEFGKKALIVTGKNSSKINGSLDDICKALDKENIEYKIYDKVEPNPSISTIKQGSQISRDFNSDFIIGLGGGSPLDAAKAIAVLTHNQVEGEDIFSGDYKEKVLPNIAIPTTAGTGSEVTQYSIITDTINNKKRNLSCKNNFPKYAFLDAKYMAKLNKEITSNTAIDALSHSIEGYLAKRSNPMSNLIAENSINILGEVLPEINENISLENREKLLYASMLAGMVISQAGTTAVHAMGYSLTYYKKIDHGKSNAYLLSPYLDFIEKEQKTKVNKIYELMNLKNNEEFKNLITNLLNDKLNLREDEILKYASSAIKEANINNTIPIPNLEDLIDLYKKSL